MYHLTKYAPSYLFLTSLTDYYRATVREPSREQSKHFSLMSKQLPLQKNSIITEHTTLMPH